jgi:hypothetical protein
VATISSLPIPSAIVLLWAGFGPPFAALTERDPRRSRTPVPPGAVAG